MIKWTIEEIVDDYNTKQTQFKELARITEDLVNQLMPNENQYGPHWTTRAEATKNKAIQVLYREYKDLKALLDAQMSIVVTPVLPEGVIIQDELPKKHQEALVLEVFSKVRNGGF